MISHLRAPNRGSFFLPQMYQVWSQLTQCAGIRWYTVNKRRNAFDLLVNGDGAWGFGLCSVCSLFPTTLYSFTLELQMWNLKASFQQKCRDMHLLGAAEISHQCLSVENRDEQGLSSLIVGVKAVESFFVWVKVLQTCSTRVKMTFISLWCVTFSLLLLLFWCLLPKHFICSAPTVRH